MTRLEEGERVHGPYEVGRRWRLIVKGPSGQRAISFATRDEAERAREELRGKPKGPTVGEAVELHLRHMKEKGLKPCSIVSARFRLESFFGLKELGSAEGGELAALTPERCAALYTALTGKVKVDTHRNSLAVAKTFGKWCVKQGWIASNPLASVEPVGRRRRGKEQLRVDEARAFLACCQRHAAQGDAGAVASMMALLLGLRASEIAERVVRDLDDGGRLLWIPSAKTERGKRTLEVPEALQPHLKRLAEGKKPGDRLLPMANRFWVRSHVQRMCRLAGVPVVTAHSMRGLHATLATEWGSTGRVVAAALGHTSFDVVTRRHYLQPGTVERAALRRVVEVIGDASTPPAASQPAPLSVSGTDSDAGATATPVTETDLSYKAGSVDASQGRDMPVREAGLEPAWGLPTGT